MWNPYKFCLHLAVKSKCDFILMVMHFDISNSELLVLQVMQSHVQSDYSMDTFYW